MSEEPKSSTKPAKLVEVQIVSKNSGALLVQYYDKVHGVQRVTVPPEVIKDGKAPLEELEAGIPYGINWDGVKIKAFSIEDVVRALHDEGIWTKEDLAQRRAVVYAAINRVAGTILSDLLPQIK